MPLDISTPLDTYSALSSSPDPYATTPDATPPFIDISGLPSGLPILGPLTGYTPTNLTRLIQARHATTSQTLSRPLSEQELTAIAYHSAKGHAIASWGPSLGIGMALYRIRATRAEFRWPFYGALKSEELGKGFWDGESMRIGGREILKQVPANLKASGLHVLRGSAYVALGLMVVPAVVSTYGATVSAVGEIRDQRLGGVTAELRTVAERERGGRGRRDERLGEVVGRGGRDAGGGWRERRERLEGRGNVDDDDTSPTSGGGMFGDDDEQGRLGTVGDMLGDGQMREKEIRAQPSPRRNPTDTRASTFQIDKVAKQPRDFGDDFDDASPTGENSGGGGDEAAGGSVWERIRQRNAAGSSNSSSAGSERGFRREQRGGDTSGDSFSFSGSEEEKSYAKDEKQREFDERVEKERRGGDFGGGGGSGWRR